MGKLRACLSVIGGLLALFAIAELLAGWLGTDRKLTLLAVMLCASGLLTVALALQKRKLRQTLLQVPWHERKSLEQMSDEFKYAFPRAGLAKARNTVLAGKVFVSGPIIPCMLAPLFAVQAWSNFEPPVPQFIALGAGFAAAWFWWSVSVYHWRRWAQQRGMSSAEVQYHGEAAGLFWPRGHFLERTEWKHRSK